MRLFDLLGAVLLIMVLTVSCRSHKETQSHVVEVATVTEQSRDSMDSVSRILERLLTVENVELSGISVDFFPPEQLLDNDSLLPDIPATPRSLHIDKMNISRKTETAAISSAEVHTTELHDFKAASSTEILQRSESEGKIFSTSVPAITLGIVAALLIGGLIVYFKYIRNRRK